MQGVVLNIIIAIIPYPHNVAIKQEIQRSLKKLNEENFDGMLFDEKCIKSMREMERMVDQKEIFISMFGQHNCGKSTLTNALLGEE